MSEQSRQLQEALQLFLRESICSVFPEFGQDLLSKAEVYVADEDDLVFDEKEDLDQVLIPISGEFVFAANTAFSPGESMLAGCELYHMVGVEEVCARRFSAVSMRCLRSGFVLGLSRVHFFELFGGEGQLLQSVRVLSQSSAILSFARMLRKAGVGTSDLVDILSRIGRYRLVDDKLDRSLAPMIVFVTQGNANFSFANKFVTTGDWFICPVDGAGALSFSEHSVAHVLSLNTLSRGRSELVSSVCIHRDELRRMSDKEGIRLGVEIDPSDRVKKIDLSSIAKVLRSVSVTDLRISDDSHGLVGRTVHNWLTLNRIVLPEAVDFVNVRDGERLTPLRMAKEIERHGYVCRAVELSQCDDIQENPVLTLWRGRPIVVFARVMNRYLFLDSQLGASTMRISEANRLWSSNALYIDRAATKRSQILQERSNKGSSSRVMLTLINDNIIRARSLVNNIGALEVFQFLVALTFPQFFGLIFDQALNGRELGVLSYYLIGFGLVLFFRSVAESLSGFIRGIVLGGVKYLNASSLVRQALKGGVVGGAGGASEFVSGQSLVEYYVGLSVQQYTRFPNVVISLTGFSILLLITKWQVGLVFLVACAISVGVNRFFVQARFETINGLNRSRVEVFDRIHELIRGISTIKTCAIENEVISRVGIDNLGLAEKEFLMSKFHSIKTLLLSLIAQVTIYFSIYSCIADISSSNMGLGALVAISLYLGFGIELINELCGIQTLQLLKTQLSDSVLPKSLPKREFDETGTMAIQLMGDISLDGVSYRYGEKGGKVLSDISFSVKPGQIVAIVGRSGSGKTTLGKLLTGQLMPSGGRILVDGKDLREVAPSSVRQYLSYVSQHPQLYSGTILSNIAFDEDSPDLEQVKTCAKATRAHDFIKNLSNHYFYSLYEGGVGISAGQRHQIALARALYKRPRLLVIDEATAHLDPAIEKSVSDGVMRLMDGRTVFVIVHRLAVARRADTILVLKDGRLVESGSHEELIRKNGEYTEMYRHQTGVELQ